MANGRNTEKGRHKRTGPRSIQGLQCMGTRGDNTTLSMTCSEVCICTIVHMTVCQWAYNWARQTGDF